MTEAVVVISNEIPVNYKELEAIDERFPSSLILVVGGVEAGSRIFGQRLSAFPETVEGLDEVEKFLDATAVKAVLFREEGFDSCNKGIFTTIISKSLPIFYEYSEAGVVPYKFPLTSEKFGSSGKKALFVYPGKMIPVTNGSRQRAWSLFQSLLFNEVDLTLAMPSSESDSSYHNFITQFGVQIKYFNESKNIKYFIRRVRAVLKNILGLEYYLPFFCRLGFAFSEGYKAFLQNELKDKDIAVFSYAWMVPQRQLNFGNCSVMIDSHDVNFIRDANYYKKNNLVEKFISSKNEFFERRALNVAKKVFAISKEDYSIFSSMSLKPKVCLMQPSFDWVEYLEKPSSGRATSFGFIGANMIANRLAIDYIVEIVWPEIMKIRPGAKLYVAGNICSHLPKDKLIPGVIPVGFVSSLRSFYGKIDSLISPVLMQGGLNIKILESLCSGVPVLVNELGDKSLPSSGLIYKANDSFDSKCAEDFLHFCDRFKSSAELRRKEAMEIKAIMSSEFQQGVEKITSHVNA